MVSIDNSTNMDIEVWFRRIWGARNGDRRGWAACGLGQYTRAHDSRGPDARRARDAARSPRSSPRLDIQLRWSVKARIRCYTAPMLRMRLSMGGGHGSDPATGHRRGQRHRMALLGLRSLPRSRRRWPAARGEWGQVAPAVRQAVPVREAEREAELSIETVAGIAVILLAGTGSILGLVLIVALVAIIRRDW